MEKFTMNDTTIAFIGLGLIGGSLAKGIKKARPDIRIMAYMRTRSKLEQAKKDGIVDVILDGIDEQLKQCPPILWEGGEHHESIFISYPVRRSKHNLTLCLQVA